MLELICFALGVLAGGGGAWYWLQRRNLCRAVFAAVPKPWQVVSAKGDILLANPALDSFFAGDQRPIPVLLSEQVADDEETGQQIRRLEEQATPPRIRFGRFFRIALIIAGLLPLALEHVFERRPLVQRGDLDLHRRPGCRQDVEDIPDQGLLSVLDVLDVGEFDASQTK